jgi:hypothetical protein
VLLGGNNANDTTRSNNTNTLAATRYLLLDRTTTMIHVNNNDASCQCIISEQQYIEYHPKENKDQDHETNPLVNKQLLSHLPYTTGMKIAFCFFLFFFF